MFTPSGATTNMWIVSVSSPNITLIKLISYCRCNYDASSDHHYDNIFYVSYADVFNTKKTAWPIYSRPQARVQFTLGVSYFDFWGLSPCWKGSAHTARHCPGTSDTIQFLQFMRAHEASRKLGPRKRHLLFHFALFWTRFRSTYSFDVHFIWSICSIVLCQSHKIAHILASHPAQHLTGYVAIMFEMPRWYHVLRRHWKLQARNKSPRIAVPRSLIPKLSPSAAATRGDLQTAPHKILAIENVCLYYPCQICKRCKMLPTVWQHAGKRWPVFGCIRTDCCKYLLKVCILQLLLLSTI